MATSVSRILAAWLFVLLLASSSQAQDTLTVHHNANLREKASTQAAILDHLEPGDELTLLSEAQRFGFYHVETESGTRGWIYRTLVHFDEEEDEEGEPGAAPSASGVFDEFDENWPKPAPTGKVLKGPAGFDPCPARGEDGGDYATNSRKNRTDVPASYKPISFDAFMGLPDPHASSTKRQDWTQAQKDDIAPYEGVAVSIVGYINRVKRQDGGKGESTNCHFAGDNRFVDIHMALVEDYYDAEKEAIVVEPTPRFYAKHPNWVWDTMIKLEHSKTPVRISGWTLFDPSHRNHMGKFRKSMWEIHPITKIEILKNGQWVEY